jgi:multidrug resistance efflux pump
MLQRIVLPLMILAALAGLLSGCASTPSAKAASLTDQPAAKAAVEASAEAYVHPLREVSLAFKSGGRLAEVAVKEGETVQAGQVLLRLDDASLQAALAQAEAALTRAQAQLAQTQAGAREAQVAQAEAGVARAAAALAQAKAGPTKEQIAVAEARVRTLQAQLAAAQAGTRPEAIEASSATVQQAEAAVRVAQANYDKIAGDPDHGASPQALALQDATLQLQAARANHEALQHGPTASDIAVLNAQVAEGRAALAQTKAGSTPEQIAQAEAALSEAQAQLDLVKAGARTEEVAVAQAAVKEAEAGVAQARAALADATLSAPFAGTVGAMDLEAGQYVAPGASVITLADLSGWKLLTDNLTEKEVVRVAAGQPVKVTLDALPGQTLAGTVTRIKPRSETKAGDVTYTVEIALPGPQSGLRWGMTASVLFAGQ